MPLIGTAGHVDHGKSTLIERLTGRDPDRWEEEKRRGLTIDLGFAWTVLPSGMEVSFVDVPGHERYLKNMLAGVEAVDIALFVVAADEGWMPQSEEHLAVLDLLDVNRGVLTLTKRDLVDDELAELAKIDATERLQGTSLAGAPVIPVSATRGLGIDELVETLDALATRVDPTDIGRPRMWIDRSFSMRGAGTVVTGTLLDGTLAVDQEVTVYPAGAEVRIRGIQTHERTVNQAGPGRRVALNLTGIEHREVRRGDMVGLRDHWEVSDRFSAAIRTPRYVRDLDPRGAYQLHIGSGTHQMRFLGVERGSAVVATDSPLPVTTGDPFIVRDTGRRLVTAGGRVLDPSPGATRQALRRAHRLEDAATPEQIADVLLEMRGSDTEARLAAHSRGGRPAGGTRIEDRFLAPGESRRLGEAVHAMVAEQHRAHPLRPGAPVATMAEHLGVSQQTVERIVADSDHLVRIGPDVAEKGHQADLQPAAAALWQHAWERLGQSLAVPTTDELGLDPEVLHLMLRRDELVRVSDQLVYLPEQIDRIRAHIQAMPSGFRVADFRDATGLSRKYAVPILEWADREGLTQRTGDTRTPR